VSRRGIGVVERSAETVLISQKFGNDRVESVLAILKWLKQVGKGTAYIAGRGIGVVDRSAETVLSAEKLGTIGSKAFSPFCSGRYRNWEK